MVGHPFPMPWRSRVDSQVAWFANWTCHDLLSVQAMRRIGAPTQSRQW